MLGFKHILAFLLLGLASAAPTGEEVDGSAPPLFTMDQFHSMKGTYFVKFYSPYCPHCRALEPKWNGAFQEIVGANVDTFQWASVNCVEQGDLCSEESVAAYPTMRVYKDGKRVYDYTNSAASQADLRSFATSYASKREAALSKEFEMAPQQEFQREQAAEEQQEADKARAKEEEDIANRAKAKEAARDQQEAQDKENLEQEAKNLANAAAIMAEANSDQDEAVRESRERSHDEHRMDSEEPRTSEYKESSESTGNTKEATEVSKESSEETRVFKEDSDESKAHGSDESSVESSFESTDQVTALGANDFGPSKNVGRWFVLFTTRDCQGCDSLGLKWENHERFAKDIQGINWGRVDCDANSGLCDSEQVYTFPTLRIYQDGTLMYNYKGSTDTMFLRKFVRYASVATSFDGFSIFDLDRDFPGINMGEHQPNDGQNQAPNYLNGPVVPKPAYGNDPKIMDVVQYTLSTLGNPIDEDPGKLIFGDSPEAHHNFRTWGAPDAPPPPFVEPGSAATYASGKVNEFGAHELETVVKSGTEPWLIKFYSPKCSYCVSMAPEFEVLAENLKNKLNVGAVNCEAYPNVCEAANVTHWPFITLYRGPTALEEYTGARTAQAMSEYAQQVWAAQIYPLENEEDLSREIVQNLDKNLTTFVYLYDPSVMAEDWDSLTKIAVKINNWGGKLYRSNSEQLRERAGIKHRGSAFVNVDLVGEPGEGTLKWYDYPWSNIPKRIRDTEDVHDWALRAKYTLLQYLDPISQTKYSPYVAVVLTEGNLPPSKDKIILDHKQKALELRDFYRDRQINDQDRIRVDRLNQHDAALLDSKFEHARNLMKQQIDLPLFTDLAFAYIPHSKWTQDYSRYIDTGDHKVGNVIVVDFYSGVYIDQFNHLPIKDDRDVLDDLVEFLHRYENRDPKTIFTALRHFKKTMRGVPKPLHRSTHFHLKSSEKFFSFSCTGFLKYFAVFVAVYVLYVRLVRPRLRRNSNRRIAGTNWPNSTKDE